MLQKTETGKKNIFSNVKRSLNLCSPEKEEILDCTFGSGGYTKEILKYPNTKVIAIDRDKFTEEKARKLERNTRIDFYIKTKNLVKFVNLKMRTLITSYLI